MTTSLCLLLLLAEAYFVHVRAHRICKGTARCASKMMPFRSTTLPTALPLVVAQPPMTSSVMTNPPPGPTFGCIADAYLVQENRYYTVNLIKGKTNMISDKILFQAGKTEINGLGFNTLDSFLYGVREKMLVRMMADGSSQNVTELPFKHVNMGAFDMDGQYWFSSAGGRWGQIDLTPRSVTYGELKSSGKSERKGLHRMADWAFTPKYPGSFWAVNVDKEHNPALFNWSTETHKWQEWYKPPRDISMEKSKRPYAFGAVVSTSDGIIYGIDNRSSDIYRFPLDNLNKSAEVGKVEIGRRSDGARCMTQLDWKE